MAAPSLDAVLNHPAVWRGGDCARVTVPSVPTGFAELDALLPGGGWPGGALTEIFAERTGIGELQILMPAAARLTRAGRWLVLIAPPYIPYAPALAAHGVKLSHLMLIQPQTGDEILWACEQALRMDDCGAILTWLDTAHDRTLRRLQLAAEGGGAIAVLFRPARAIPASPAALRLHVGKTGNKTIIRILKRRGGAVPDPMMFELYGSAPGRPKSLCAVASDRAHTAEAVC